MAPFGRNRIWQWEYISGTIGATGQTCDDGWGYGLEYHNVGKYAVFHGKTTDGTWKLDHTTGIITLVPASLSWADHGTVWDSYGQRLLSAFGGQPSFAEEIREYTDAAWIDRTPVVRPNDRKWPGGAVNQDTNTFYIFSGSNRQDNWKLDLETMLWTQFYPAVNPPMNPWRDYHTGAWCPVDGCYYIFGGWSNNDGNYNDIWKLEADESTWVEVTPAGMSAYSIVRKPVVEWIPGANAFVIIGGNNFGGTADLVVRIFNPISGDFEDITSQCIDADVASPYPRTNPWERGEGAGYYDPSLDLIVIGPGQNKSLGGQSNPEFWTLTPAPAYALDPDIAGCNGGETITITGAFPANEAVQIFIGPRGDQFDTRCYGGEGNGYYPVSTTGTSLKIAAPPLSTGTQKVTVRINGENFAAENLEVVERNWQRKVYSIRAGFPPWKGVGNRRLELETLSCPSAPVLPADEEEMSRLPRLTWVDATTLGIAAPPGNVDQPLQYRLQDGVTRTLSATGGNWDPSSVAEWGLDTGVEAVSTWYNLFLVEKSGAPTELVVKGSTNGYLTGPSGHSEFLYIGAVFNDSLSALSDFDHIGNRFLWKEYGGLTLPGGAAAWDGSVQTMNLLTDRTGGWIPATAEAAQIGAIMVVASGANGQFRFWKNGEANRFATSQAQLTGNLQFVIPLVAGKFDYQRLQLGGSLVNSLLHVQGWIDGALPG